MVTELSTQQYAGLKSNPAPGRATPCPGRPAQPAPPRRYAAGEFNKLCARLPVNLTSLDVLATGLVTQLSM